MTSFEEIVVTKPWGYEYLVYQNTNIAVWMLCISPGKRTSLHKHERKVTQLIVISGELKVKVHNALRIMCDGDYEVIEKGTPHQTENRSSINAYLIEIEYPNDKLDLVRISDDFGRAGQGYESQSKFVTRKINHNYIDFTDYNHNSVLSKRIRDTRIHFFNSGLVFMRDFLKASNTKEIKFLILDGDQEMKIQGQSEIFGVVGTEESGLDLMTKRQFLVFEFEVQNIPGYDKLADALIDVFGGVIFGTLGDMSLHFCNHAARVDTIEIDLYRSDRTASLAAEGYSFISQSPAILVVSSENGFVDAFKAIINCLKDKTPIIVLRFTADSSETIVNQLGPSKNLESRLLSPGLFTSSKELIEPDFTDDKLYEVLDDLKNNILGKEPGPVMISVSLDVLMKRYQRNQVKYSGVDSSLPTKNGLSLHTKSAVTKLLSSPRPLIVIGRNVRICCSDEDISNFLDFAESAQIPIVTSRSGIDLIENWRMNYLGRVGTYGNRHSNTILHQAETILFLGTSLSQAQTGKNPTLYGIDAKKILINEVNESCKMIDHSIELLDVGIEEFIVDSIASETRESGVRRSWFEYCSYLKRNFAQNMEFPIEIENSIGLVLRNLTSVARNGTIFCVDGGSLLHHFTQNAALTRESRVVNSSIMEATGISFASALGVSHFAQKLSRSTIAITDSFGIFDNMSHIEDIRDKNRNIKFIYLSENTKRKNWNQDFLYPGSSVGISSEIASDRIRKTWIGYELPYVKIEAQDVASLKEAIISDMSSLLIEIPVNLSTQLVPRVSYERLPDGRFQQNSLLRMDPEKTLLLFNEFEKLRP